VKRVNNSVLVLKHFNDESTANLKAHAKAHGLRVTDDNTSQFKTLPTVGGAGHLAMKRYE
jgi:predicted O-linked N-acetylglucosamine transferase (SPINDLY family)